MLAGRTVVLGVSGGIAAYKACDLARRLQDRGATVIVVMTAAAREFVTPLTFQALTGNPVVTELWGDQRPRFELPAASRKKARGRVEHVDVAEAADCVIVAPATADLMARLVHGEAPDALTATVLATPAPVVIAPSMDAQMWKSAATQANVRVLRGRGFAFVGPESGALASGLSGVGRLAETDTMLDAVERALTHRESLKGVRVLIGAGRTEEALDPVRVLTNRSSGKMGFALAEAARDRGADVTLIAGPTSLEAPHGIRVTQVTTAEEMKRALLSAAKQADLVLMAAAVADYRPAKAAREKIKRTDDSLTLKLVPNPDVLAAIGTQRRRGQVLAGFALETSNGIANARKKLKSKGVDLIVLNSPSAGIGGDTNQVTLIEASKHRALPKLPKREVAEAILDRLIELRDRAPAGGPGAKRGGTKKRGSRR